MFTSFQIIIPLKRIDQEYQNSPSIKPNHPNLQFARKVITLQVNKDTKLLAFSIQGQLVARV